MNNKMTEKLAQLKLSSIFTGLAIVAALCVLLFIANKEYHESNSFQDFPKPAYASKINADQVSETLDYSYLIQTVTFDKTYVSITQDTFEKFNDVYIKMVFYNTSYQEGSYECNHFALLYKSLLGATVIKGNVNAAIAVGAAIVTNKNAFGGVPASNGSTSHMVCMVMVDDKWLVVEPQPQNGYLTYCEIEKYPNPILYTIF